MITDLLLMVCSAVLTLVSSRFIGYHSGFLISVFLSAAAWSWLRTADHVAAWSSMGVVVAAFLGGLTATVLATGIAEDNAVPSATVRRQVEAHHRDANLHCPQQPRGKRLFDVVLASVGVVLTLPLWLVIVMLVWLEEPGPVLFVKNSVGRAGVTFRQFKFRSMRYRAEDATGPVVSCPGDTRTLRVGRRLRQFHLDELPELINVVAGTMSLVGPRPLRTVLVHEHLRQVPGFAERHTVRPGIACTAQIERYRMPPEERLRKDLAYIAGMSLRTDIVLLVRAVLTTLAGVRDRTEEHDCRMPPAQPDRGTSLRHRVTGYRRRRARGTGVALGRRDDTTPGDASR